MDLFVQFLIIIHLCFGSHAISVRDYASNKLQQEYTKRDVRGQADNSELLDGNKFPMSTFDVQFDCENKIKGQIIETEFNLLILSGSELFAINTNANGSTLDKLAILGGVNTSPLNAKATFWTNEKIILVLAFSTHYSIYKIPFGIHQSSVMPPIQKIRIIQEIPVKIALYRRGEELFCLLASKISKFRGILRLYNWHLMHFKEEINQHVSGMDDVLHTKWNNNEEAAIATVFVTKEKKLEIRLLNRYTLVPLQTLNAHGKFVRFIELHEKTFLAICSVNFCDIYQWVGVRFNHWRRVNLLGGFHEFRIGHNVIIYRFNHTMFVSNRADLTPIGSINCTTARIYFHKMHESDTIWAVSVFVEPPQMRLNFIEIPHMAAAEPSAARHHVHESPFVKFHECTKKLKQEFNTIYGGITRIASLNPGILRRDRIADFPGKIIVKNYTKINENATVGVARIPIDVAATPTELLKNVAHLNLRKLQLQTEIENAFKMAAAANTTSSHPRRLRRRDIGENGTSVQREKWPSIRRERVKVGNLRTNSEKWLKLLLKNSSKVQRIALGNVKSLQVANLNVSHTINGINIDEDLYNLPENLVQNKFINIMNCKHLIVKNSINSIHINDFFGLFAKGRAHHASTFHVDQVIVENIQEMNFDTLYQSLYLHNSSREIDGNLIFYNVTTVTHMEAGGINGRATDDLVPLHTNQIINSTIRINQFRVEHFEADTVNDIEFRQETLALIGKDNHFQGPIQLYGLYSKDLVLAEGDEETPERIIGTHIDDLSQVYMGQVVVKGNLHVGTLHVASKNNFLANVPFNLTTLGDYWYKGLDQDFANVIFHGNVTAPQLYTKHIDHHDAGDYLTTRQDVVPKNVSLFLKSAHIGGHLHTTTDTLANQISDSCVRVNERAIVRGVKTFTGKLRVENLVTSHLNGDPIAKMVLKNYTSLVFPSLKHFSTLHVHDGVNVGAANVHIDRIHGVDLRELIEKCVMIDEAQNITFVQANGIEARDIDVKTLNSVAFGKSIRDIEKMKIHVEIQGNATFSNNVHLMVANGVNLDAFLPLVAQKSTQPLQIGGMKNFTSIVKILNSLTTQQQMNGINVGDWLRDALVNGTKQIVREEWSVQAVRTPRIDVSTINGVKVKHLMDTEGSVHLQSDLHVEEITVNSGDIFGRINIDFNRTVKLLIAPTVRRWGVLHVHQHTYWPLGSLSPLTELLTNAIHAHREQEIVGEVHFANASVNHLNAHFGINGIYVENLAQDALRRYAENQVIFGDKHFLRALNVQNLQSNDYLSVPIVNNVDILELNGTMLRNYQRNICINDPWTFRSKLKTNSLVVEGKLNGVEPHQFVITTQKYGSKLPVALFHNLAIVGNLTVAFVDNMPIDHLLYDRAQRVAEKNQDFRGAITFKDAILADYADVFSINGVEINSLFLTKATHVQDVVGLKKCRGNLELLGPSSVSYLNSRDIGDLYANSLFLHEDHHIEDYGFMRVHAPELKVMGSVNGIVIGTLGYMENSSLSGVPEVMDIAEEIHTMGRKPNFAVAKKKRFNYFDYVNTTPAVVGGSSSPKVVRSVNIDADFGGWRMDGGGGVVCNGSECQCGGRRYSVAMLRDRSIVVRRVESVSRGSQKAWNGVEVSTTEGHVQNCISQAVAGANTTITFTIRHSGNVTKIEKVLKGGTFHMDFLKIESPTREVLVTIATRDGNLTRIHLAGVNKATPSVTIHQILSLSTITSTTPKTTINVMEYTKHVYLIVGTPKSTLNGSILVYKLAKGAPKFQHRQTIEGNYFTIRCNDALGMIIVGNRGSNFVSIYRVDDESEDFKLFQSIKLQSTLGMLSTFALAENQFFVIALQNDNIHIYKYNYIEGWVLICVNQYPNIESLTPFTLDGEGYLLAITSTNATAIALFSQTEH